MSTEERKVVVARFVDAFLSRDAAAIKEVVEPDLAKRMIERYIPGNDARWGEKTIGITDMMAEGDKVWARVTEIARHIAEWQGVPSTDKVTTFTGILFLRVCGGKVVALKALWDKLGRGKLSGGRIVPGAHSMPSWLIVISPRRLRKHLSICPLTRDTRVGLGDRLWPSMGTFCMFGALAKRNLG